MEGAIADAHATNLNMGDALSGLQEQRQVIESIFEYNKKIDAIVNKATGEVYAIERATWAKKIAMFIITALLFLAICILIILRMINWF